MSATVRMAKRLWRHVLVSAPRNRAGPTPTHAAVMIAATSGISGYIDASGRIVQQTGQFTPAIVSAEVTPRTGFTLATRLGADPEWVMMILGLLGWALAAAAGRRRRRLDAAFGTTPKSATQTAGDSAVTASSGTGAAAVDAPSEGVSSLPAPASSASSVISVNASNARKAHT